MIKQRLMLLLVLGVSSLQATNRRKWQCDKSYWGGTFQSLHQLAGSADQPIRLFDALNGRLKNCNLDAVDEAGRTPLALANKAGHIENIVLLLEFGADHTRRGVAYPCPELKKFWWLYDKAMAKVTPEEITRELRRAKIEEILIQLYEESEVDAKNDQQEWLLNCFGSTWLDDESFLAGEICSPFENDVCNGDKRE